MKIRRLQFKNINNLKGAHEISFDKLPLSTAGIFAIVGPTGSGKSTILDVITLALFNRIPRFKKSISKNEITNEGSVLTHHTSEASASIEYEIKGLTYRSSWSVSTNRNGKLKDYEMFLYNPDGTVADLKKSEVPNQNEVIIGLNYDQFIKSILLSQGEFSKFLKADKNDRGKLLENITGTSIYRTIGISAFEKHKEVKETLDIEKGIIGEINILADVERQELITQLQDSKTEKEKIDIRIAESSQLKQIKLDIIEIKQSLQEEQKDEALINSQMAAFKDKQVKLDLHHKLSHVQGPLATYNDAVSNTYKSQENLEQYQIQLEEAQNNHDQTIDELANLTKSKVSKGTFKKIMNDFETEINNTDRDLENLKNNGRAARERVNKNIFNYPIPIIETIKTTDAINLLSIRAEELEAILIKAQLESDKPTAEIRKRLKQKQEELESLKKLQAHYENIATLQLKLKGLQKKLEKLIAFKTTHTPLINKCRKLVDVLSEKIELLLKRKEDAITILELEDFRNALVTDTPCPLCGSLEHPYAEHKPELHETEIDNKIKLARKEQQEQQRELESLSQKMTQCITSIEHHQNRIAESAQQLYIEEVESAKIIAMLNGQSKIDQNNIAQSIDTISKRNETTESAIHAIDELKLNKNLVQQYNQLHTCIEDYKELKQSRDSKFTGSEVNVITNKLQDAFERSKSKITESTVVIKKETDALKRDTGLVKSISKDLNAKIEELGFSSITEISAHILDEATLNYLTKERDQLKKQQTSIDTKVKTYKEDLVKKLQEDTKPEQMLDLLVESMKEQKALMDKHQYTVITNQGLIKRDDEDRSRRKSKEKAITKLSQELEKWSLLNKMIGDASGNKFANFAQGLTLQNLLVYANRRLQNLSDRYLLDKPKNDGALIVIDKYQGNTSRSVTTLSGGESFLISLALALSLSDMASKNVALECLFIDEGFGTLDPESLESALSTLEKLQSESQKMVGVISHVEALKERIDVQLKLNKNAQGYSQIEVLSQNEK
ncbi:MAG: exonuclease SbcC [Saprospiraceae bacterium]|jgi:exonuclease SbcC